MKITLPSFALAVCVGFALGFAAPTTTRGEDAPDAPSIDVKFSAEPEMPERELTFTESQEEVPIKLFVADPKLLEQRYVATIHLQRPAIGRSDYLRSFSVRQDSTPLDKMKRLYWSTLVDHTSRSRSRSSSTMHMYANAVFKQVAEDTPPERKPPEDALSLLLDEQRVLVPEQTSPAGLLSRSQPGGDVQVFQVLQLLGPDVETTKAMSLALLHLYDEGLSLPIQEHLIAEMQQRAEQLPMMLTNFKAVLASVPPLLKDMAGLPRISEDAIEDLQTQKRLIAIDIVGAQARVDACEKILKGDEPGGPKVTDQVESLKLTAEIELVGLSARQDAIGKMIDAGNQRRHLAARYSRQNSTAEQMRTAVEKEVKSIAALEESRKRYLPIPVGIDKIQIQPIKWVPASATTFGGR